MTTDEQRAAASRLAAAAVGDGAPTRWFEELYAGAATGDLAVPWADLEPNPWLTSAELPEPAGRALVVGCGYGDDAEWLAQQGFAVTAFDISPTAVEHCRTRFPDSSVTYVAADLLDPPAWEPYDLVVEIYTLQVLPPGSLERRAGVQRLAALTGGTLLVICRGREPDDDPGRMPWPLTRDDLAPLEASLTLQRFEDLVADDDGGPVRRFRVTCRR